MAKQENPLGVCEVVLSNGYHAKISKIDLHAVAQFKWSANDCSKPSYNNVKKVYAARQHTVAPKKRERWYMHRFIMARMLVERGLDPLAEMAGRVVDHGDGDT